MSFHPVVRPQRCTQVTVSAWRHQRVPFRRRNFTPGVRVLEDLGFRVYYTARLFEKHYYLAGSDAARAAELNALFADPAIKAIFCCRGGTVHSACSYLDTATIMAHPKIFVGYSDLTTLLLYLYSQCHLVTLHGPVVVGDLHPGLEPGMLRQLQGILTGDEAAMQPPAEYLDSLTVLRAGEAEGRLLSCCLSLLVCAVGTPFQPQTRDTIVFLEDRGERLYAIDRMLTYLKLAGVLQGVRGLVFGQIERVAADRHLSYGMEDIIMDVLGDLEVPILYGFPAGHCPQPLTLPFGVRVAIRGGRLVLCESPVVSQHGAGRGVHAGA